MLAILMGKAIYISRCLNTWVSFRIIPEFRILELNFLNTESDRLKKLIRFEFSLEKQFITDHLIFCRKIASFEILIS